VGRDDDPNSMMHGPQGPDTQDLLLDLFAWCARELVANPDVPIFLDKFAAQGPVLFPEFVADGLRTTEDASRFFRTFGWGIASAMPLPSLNFRPHKLTLPGRNEPCLCGSGQKFKHCCAAIVPAFPKLDADMLGGLVIEAMPRRAWAALPMSRVPLRMVEAAADSMSEIGDTENAARLLAGWAALPPPWPDARADLLDRLGDLYLDLGKPRKRKQLAQAMVDHGGPSVQSKGWQRLSLLATDAGDAAGARRAFEAAQRLAPDDPSVAFLEVTTLAGRGDMARARERADFHARRLGRLPQAEALADAIDALAEMAEADSPLDRRMQGIAGGDTGPSGPVAQLEGWLEALPEPRLRLVLPAAPSSDLGALRPTPAAIKALKRWHAAFSLTAPRMAWDEPIDDDLAIMAAGDWMPVLQSAPLLADCFEVIDGLLLALEALPPPLASALQARLLERALGLWSALRAEHPEARCEWGHLDNRPALRLLALRIELDTTPTASNSFEWLRHIVEVLNPNDNHGFRERLAAVYLRRGETDRALALCERYPDDGVGMRLLTARTLLALHRAEPAAVLVASALADNPHLKKLLLASRAPRRPNVPSYAIGSVDEAKIALAPQFDLWRDDPVVRQWLKTQLEAPSADRTPDLFDADGSGTNSA
jgi:SEC-C motif